MARRATSKPERPLLSRTGRITGYKMDVHLTALTRGRDGRGGERGRASSVYLDLTGEFTEKVKGVSAFSVMLHALDSVDVGAAEIPSVGVVLRLKPHLEAVVSVTHAEFQTLVALAVAGSVRWCQMSFQEPRYGSGLISGIFFTSTTEMPQ